MCAHRSIWPAPPPKPVHTAPVSGSSAIRRPSAVGMNRRARQPSARRSATTAATGSAGGSAPGAGSLAVGASAAGGVAASGAAAPVAGTGATAGAVAAGPVGSGVAGERSARRCGLGHGGGRSGGICGRGRYGRLGRLVGKATTREVLQRQPVLDLRVVAPDLGAAGGVERDHQLVRRAQVEAVADLQRRDFVGGLDRVARAAAQVAGAELPRQFQSGDVVRRDLRQRRIALAEAGAAVGAPLAGRHAAIRPAALSGRGALARRAERALDLVRIMQPRGPRQQHEDAERQAQGQAAAMAKRRHPMRRRALALPRRIAGVRKGRIPAVRQPLGRGAEAGRPLRRRRPRGRAQPGRHPRQQQQHAEHEQQPEPCRQRPPIQPRLPHRPQQRAAEQQRVGRQRGLRARQQQGAAQQQPQTGRQVVPAAAQHDQPAAARRQRQPQQQQQGAEHDRTRAAAPLRFPGGRIR